MSGCPWSASPKKSLRSLVLLLLTWCTAGNIEPVDTESERDSFCIEMASLAASLCDPDSDSLVVGCGGYSTYPGKGCSEHREWFSADCDATHISCRTALDEGKRQCERQRGHWYEYEVPHDALEVYTCCQSSAVGCMDIEVTCGE